MSSEWRETTWGDEVSLEYGKGIRGYKEADGPTPVFGTNGQVGWTEEPLAPGPGIILGRKGAYRGIHYSKEPFFVIDTAYYIKPKSALNMRWLYYSMIYNRLGSIDDGSPIPSTTRAAVYVRKFEVPNDNTQRAIAKILGDLDDKIDLLREMNRTLEDIARAVFRAWFVDFEPVCAKAAGATSFRGMPQPLFDQLPNTFTDSDIGEIPDGWGVGRVDDLLDHPRRAANPNEIESTTPYIGLEHMPRRSITLGEWETAEKVTSNKHRFERQEILFGKLRPNFHKVGVTFVEGVCSTDIVVLRPIKPEFFGLGLACVSSDEFVAHNVVASSGTKMPRTNWEIIARYELAVPPETSGIISGFDTIIRSLVYKLEANTLEIATLSGLRNTLLPKLISGELEAPDLDTLGLTACRELMDSHPESLVIRQQVEALEEAMPDKPGIAVSFCRTLIETTCKTILTERGKPFDNGWKADKLWLETKGALDLGQHRNGQTDRRLHNATEKIISGFNSVFEGIITIRNDHGMASHGAEAYAPLLDYRYAEMLVRATDAIIGLLFKLHLNVLGGPSHQLMRYEDSELTDFNDWIDGEHEPYVVLETPLVASEALFRTDNNAYRAALVVYRQEREGEAETAAIEPQEADT